MNTPLLLFALAVVSVAAIAGWLLAWSYWAETRELNEALMEYEDEGRIIAGDFGSTD